MADATPGGLRPMRPIARSPFVEEILPVRDAAAPPQKPKTNCRSLAEYKKQAMDKIGGADQDMRQRNTKISGVYASLWMQDHDAFRWQGLAAHASTGVGLAMDMSDPRQQEDLVSGAASGAAHWVGDSAVGRGVSGAAHWAGDSAVGRGVSGAAGWVGDSAVGRTASGAANWAGRQASDAANWVDDRTRQPLDANARRILGQGNLAIYNEIAPASLAYAHGGMAELDCISGKLTGAEKRDFDKTRAAFADTDKGIALKQAGDQAGGEQLIRDGAAKLVHIEQDDVAQPTIYDPNPKMSGLMGAAAFLQLSGTPSQPDLSTLSVYQLTHPGASLGDQAQRDDWILNNVVPTWYQQYEQRPDLTTQRMQTILDRGRAAGGNY